MAKSGKDRSGKKDKRTRVRLTVRPYTGAGDWQKPAPAAAAAETEADAPRTDEGPTEEVAHAQEPAQEAPLAADDGITAAGDESAEVAHDDPKEGGEEGDDRATSHEGCDDGPREGVTAWRIVCFAVVAVLVALAVVSIGGMLAHEPPPRPAAGEPAAAAAAAMMLPFRQGEGGDLVALATGVWASLKGAVAGAGQGAVAVFE